MTNYALDNASAHGAAHLSGLTGLFDEFTCARIAESSRLHGARALEIGAGNGSVARWLADQVGPDGSVIAVDIDVSHIPPHERLTVSQLDLLEEPLPDGPFDIIHGRCVMTHLPNRATLLPALCERLAPGGTIIVEDFDPFGVDRAAHLLQAPAAPAGVAELWHRYVHLRQELFHESGTASRFITRIPQLLLEAGFGDVQATTWCRSWRGGEPGSWHARATLEQFRPRLVERGFPDDAVDVLVRALEDPDFYSAGRPLCSVSGRAPS
ncbi:class I SAM-dependent methyltransferase [Paractinoplanes globisporus]|uniref:Class I SAM-dependent methyltransferase n=1 Tax=Paractinoplanes globisporus TaxID=113565 RepID=A0ABW6W8K1_9ACTN|nr:class I SAM-dependent methyltransferase [Actinoplanes globisporus]